jgi:hypothetical protein
LLGDACDQHCVAFEHEFSEDEKGPQTAGFPYSAIVSMLPFCRLGRPNAAQRFGPEWPEWIAKLNDALRNRK